MREHPGERVGRRHEPRELLEQDVEVHDPGRQELVVIREHDQLLFVRADTLRGMDAVGDLRRRPSLGLPLHEIGELRLASHLPGLRLEEIRGALRADDRQAVTVADARAALLEHLEGETVEGADVTETHARARGDRRLELRASGRPFGLRGDPLLELAG